MLYVHINNYLKRIKYTLGLLLTETTHLHLTAAEKLERHIQFSRARPFRSRKRANGTKIPPCKKEHTHTVSINKFEVVPGSLAYPIPDPGPRLGRTGGGARVAQWSVKFEIPAKRYRLAHSRSENRVFALSI